MCVEDAAVDCREVEVEIDPHLIIMRSPEHQTGIRITEEPPLRPFACLSSHPVRSNPGAGCESLGDRRHRHEGPIQDAVEAAQGETIDNLFASAFGLHESTVTETGKVCGHSRLRLGDRGHELIHGAFTGLKDFEDP